MTCFVSVPKSSRINSNVSFSSSKSLPLSLVCLSPSLSLSVSLSKFLFFSLFLFLSLPLKRPLSFNMPREPRERVWVGVSGETNIPNIRIFVRFETFERIFRMANIRSVSHFECTRSAGRYYTVQCSAVRTAGLFCGFLLHAGLDHQMHCYVMSSTATSTSHYCTACTNKTPDKRVSTVHVVWKFVEKPCCSQCEM